MKRFITDILTGIMLISSLSVSAASFTDVNTGDWYYETVTTMTEKGLFVGKGNNLFCPNDTMTKAEFITVVVRALYPDIDISSDTDENWWQGAYEVAVDKGLVLENEVASSGSGKIGYGTRVTKTIDLDQPIQRQMMAMISVRALKALGETEIKAFRDSFIPDYSSVGTYYREYVCKAYGAGIIVGDEKGCFNPQNTLTRAEATMVLYRIVEPSARIQKDFSKPVTTPSSVVGQQTIREGEQSKRVPAKEGDIFIKKDGTQIVLKKGPNGVVGEGQGVAPDIGMYGTNGGYVISGNSWENQLMIGLINDSLHPYFVNGKGQSLNNNYYLVNATTGEGHWSSDWTIIEQTVAKPNYDGTTHGEVSKDAYSLYVWNDIVGMWVSNTTK